MLSLARPIFIVANPICLKIETNPINFETQQLTIRPAKYLWNSQIFLVQGQIFVENYNTTTRPD